LLVAGDGGAYVALKTRSIDVVERRARSLGIGTRRSSSGTWQFLGFADTSSAAGVFFSSGDFTVQDADSIFRHDMLAEELSEVWLEGGTQLRAILRALGAVPCGTARAQNGVSGERYQLARGSLVIVPQRTGSRPRVLGAVLRTRNTNNFISPIPQYWIRFLPAR
jgi:hypothetical protein